jgi:hypothetical protein
VYFSRVAFVRSDRETIGPLRVIYKGGIDYATEKENDGEKEGEKEFV